MLRSIRGNVTKADLILNQNECIVHLLDMNINLTKEYLLVAWSERLTRSQDFYCVHINDYNQLKYLKFSEIFDFQGIAIIKSSKVRMVIH